MSIDLVVENEGNLYRTEEILDKVRADLDTGIRVLEYEVYEDFENNKKLKPFVLFDVFKTKKKYLSFKQVEKKYPQYFKEVK